MRTLSHIQLWQHVSGAVRSESTAMFGAYMVANGLAYAYLMLVARLMSPAEYATLVTLTSVSYVLAVLMRTLQAWVIKNIIGARGEEDDRVCVVFLAAMRTLLGVGLFVFALHWLLAPWVADFLHLDSTTPIIMLGLFTLTNFLVPIPRGILIGLNRLQAAGTIQYAEPLARLALGVPIILLDLWGVNGALLAYSLGNIVAFIVGLAYLRRPLLRGSRHAVLPASAHGLDRYAILVLLINACLMGISSIDQIAVKHFLSDYVAGNYSVAFLLGRVIAMTTIALGWVIFARSATMSPTDPRRRRLLLKGLAVTGTLAFGLTAMYFVTPRLAVGLMGGAKYDLAGTYIGLVGIETTLFALVYVQAYYLISLRHTAVVWPLVAAMGCSLLLLTRYHTSVEEILLSLISVMAALLIVVTALALFTLRADAKQTTNTLGKLAGAVADIRFRN